MKDNMRTVSYAMPHKRLEALIKEIDKEYEGAEELVKTEEGSRTDIDGHCISYKYDGKPVLWAMIHSNQRTYLLRADKEFLNTEEEELSDTVKFNSFMDHLNTAYEDMMMYSGQYNAIQDGEESDYTMEEAESKSESCYQDIERLSDSSNISVDFLMGMYLNIDKASQKRFFLEADANRHRGKLNVKIR